MNRMEELELEKALAETLEQTRKDKEARFDEVARLWKTTPEENTAVREALWYKLFALGFDLYDNASNSFVTTFVKFFDKKYDPQKGDASHYFSRAMSRRKHDDENRKPRESSIEADTESGKSEQSSTQIKAGFEAWENGGSVEADVGFDATLVSLLSLILTLPDRLEGRANNPKKITYYRMFFTDSIVAAIHGIGQRSDLWRYIDHERDLFQAFQTRFLDFFMRERCKNVVEISDTEVKLHGEMVAGAPMEHPGHPLPNNVYREYLNNHEGYNIASDGSVSNQRGDYEELLKRSGIGK